MGSTRLPGKTLADLQGSPLLAHVVRRVKQSGTVDEVVVATTDRPLDDPIADLCGSLGVRCHRGDEDDVLSRFLGAIAGSKADDIVRITADCPLIDSEVIDRAVEVHQSSGADYTSNGLKRTWPRGFDVEVFTVDALRRADALATKPYEREHVTPSIYERPDKFRLVSVEAPPEDRAPEFRVCVDTSEDLEVVRRIVAALGGSSGMHAGEVVAYLREHPEVRALNQSVRQRTLGE